MYESQIEESTQMVGTIMTGIIVFIFIWIIAIIAGIILWVFGTQKRSIPMAIIGSFLCLSVIGLLISVIQVMNWKKEAEAMQSWKPPEENQEDNSNRIN